MISRRRCITAIDAITGFDRLVRHVPKDTGRGPFGQSVETNESPRWGETIRYAISATDAKAYRAVMGTASVSVSVENSSQPSIAVTCCTRSGMNGVRVGAPSNLPLRDSGNAVY